MQLIKRTIKIAGEKGGNAISTEKSLEENFVNFCIAVKMNYAFMGIDVSKPVLKRKIYYEE
ncbi:MAG: hypothetical protein ACNS60_08215 [Candidatus Cyclobacteriaceae bacterium M2_1C_046]